ncbi:MAG: AraC family transcriptional regulator [Lachnospiraceae bacterium]|nr:AraC family transcriptional regulator [Lachnospiraceae bacterium]
MNEKLLEKLKAITLEEQEILNGQKEVNQNLYISPGVLEDAPVGENFRVDGTRLLKKGRLIEIRPNTRFVHFPAHTHNYVEMVYMYSGSTTHILNHTDRLILQEGDLLFLNQNANQEILPAGIDDIAVNFIILPNFFTQAIATMGADNILRSFLLSALTGEDGITSYLHFKAKDILPVQNLMENMIWNLVENKKETNVINQTTMSLVLMNLSSFSEDLQTAAPASYEQSLVLASLQYIDKNYKDGSLTDLCNTLNEQTYFISRLLKKHAGGNFKELLQKRKLEQAAYLLLNTTLSTSKILESVGYDNSSYFHRKFKEVYGMSPKAYRSLESNKYNY